MSKLDNGVMNKPTNAGPQKRQGRSMDFFSMIDDGNNNHGQTTIAPAQVVRSGKTVYDQENYPRGQTGDRWKPKKR